ncbi:MAG: hypothetical protein WC936_07210 [Candidatus Nanoarchaeia archaeon]|jgi:hypothetical protein
MIETLVIFAVAVFMTVVMLWKGQPAFGVIGGAVWMCVPVLGDEAFSLPLTVIFMVIGLVVIITSCDGGRR